MANRTWRSGNSKQPPQERESTREKKKTLQDVCKDIKTTHASEALARMNAEKTKRHRELEDEQMAMTYGPNWKTKMPAWANEHSGAWSSKSEEIETYEEEPTDEDESSFAGSKRVIPFPHGKNSRMSKKRRAS